MTGGFTSIELTDDKGNKAATFSNPMEISMQMSKGAINPETGKAINQGDKIGIWSYETNTGKWTSEGEGIVESPDSSGNFTVNYKVAHLSYCNLDWHYGSDGINFSNNTFHDSDDGQCWSRKAGVGNIILNSSTKASCLAAGGKSWCQVGGCCEDL